MILIKSKSHHTQSIRNNSVHKFYIQFLETQCFYIIIKTCESTIGIIQLYNAAKLRHMDSPHPLTMKKSSIPPQKKFENQKVTPYSLGGGGGRHYV